jgi:hypothetical protein
MRIGGAARGQMEDGAPYNAENIVSRVMVIIDGIWMGYWIYWHHSEQQAITAMFLN